MPYRTAIMNGVEAVSGACVIYLTSMLMLLVDRAAGRSSVEIVLAIAIAGVSPLASALGGAALAAHRGKRRQGATASQILCAEADFEELRECCEALAIMDPHVGGELLAWFGDSERWACLQFAKILRSDLLGQGNRWRIHHNDVPRGVSAVLHVAEHEEEVDSEITASSACSSHFSF